MSGLTEIKHSFKLSDNTEVGVTNETTRSTINAIANNLPLGDSDLKSGSNFVLGRAGGGDPIIIPTPKGGKITFRTEASKKLELHHTFEGLAKNLELQDKTSDAFARTEDDNLRYLLLKWHYDVGASAEGSMALGAGRSVTYGVEAGRGRLFAIVRCMEKSTGTRAALVDLFQNWKIPSTIKSENDLQPGTYLITEVENSLKMKLGYEAGFDFSWVHELDDGGLKGDIGLKLEAGIKSAIGFDFSGKFALVVSRESMDESDKIVRARLFKQRKRGWEFALSAHAIAESNAGDLKFNEEEFLKAVLGIHAEQVINDLKSVKEWVEKNNDLTEKFGDLGRDAIHKFFKEVTGIDPETAFNEAKGRLDKFIDKWEKLQKETASQVWKLVEGNVPLDELKNILKKITELDEDKAREFLAEKFKDVKFFNSEIGKLLLSLVPHQDMFKAITEKKGIKEIRKHAKDLLDVLDGDVEEQILKKLNNAINSRFDLEKITDKITETEFEAIDEWLKGRIAAFLGTTADKLGLGDIRNLGGLLEKVKSLKDKIGTKAQQALTHKYGASFNYVYSRSTSNEALIDLSIDFSHSGAGAVLQKVLNGDFDDILTKEYGFVTLNHAVLTHGIKRKRTIDLTLPFRKVNIKEISESIANVEASDSEDGRILLYDLKAENKFVKMGETAGLLTVGGYYETALNKVRCHNKNSIEFSYTLRQAHKNRKTKELENSLKPLVNTYLKGTLDTGLHDWVSDLDKAIDRLEGNETGNLGNTFQSFHVHVPGKVGANWFNAPSDPSEYHKMANMLMAKMRETVEHYHFSKSYNDDKRIESNAVLMYSTFPVGFPKIHRNRLHWFKLLSDIDFGNRLFDVYGKTELGYVILHRNKWDTYRSVAGFSGLSNREIGNLLNNEIQKPSNLLRNFFWIEHQIIEDVYNAGIKLNKFKKNATHKPSEAVKLLAGFGNAISKAFGKRLDSIFGEPELNAFGALLFIEVAKAFSDLEGNGRSDEENTNAMLDLIFLKPDATSIAEDFLNTGKYKEQDALIHNRLISLSKSNK